jgi:hypothetical protein
MRQHLGALLIPIFGTVMSMAATVPQTVVTTSPESFTVRNTSPTKTIRAFHLVESWTDANGQFLGPGEAPHVAQIVDIRPLEFREFHYQAGKPLRIDGVLFDDGSIEGENVWGIERHYKLNRDVMKGGPAYPDNKTIGQSGSSAMFARIFARQYREKTGHDPIIREDTTPNYDPGGGGEPGSYSGPGCQGIATRGKGPPLISCLVPDTFLGQGFINSSFVQSFPQEDCTLGYYSAFNLFEVTCTGLANCTLPNAFNNPGQTGGKANVQITSINNAFATCSGVWLSSSAEIIGASPVPPGFNWYDIVGGFTKVIVGDTTYGGYVTDSCIESPFVSLPVVESCPVN